jgi:hypothetical protein
MMTRNGVLAGVILGALIGLTIITASKVRGQRPEEPGSAWQREELELLTARREAEEAEVRLAENRLEQAKQSSAYAESMQRKGYIQNNLASIAAIEVREHEARVAHEKVDLKELDVQIARLRRGDQDPAVGSAADDRDRRVRNLERVVAKLQEEVKELRQQVKQRP